MNDETKKKINARYERENAERAKRARELAERLPELLDAWRNGENPPALAEVLYELPVMLRLSANGAEVETSKGARFPVEHARRGLAFVRAIVANGAEWVRNGHTFHLGHYAIDRIETDGTVRAGCHVVTRTEIERIAPELERNAPKLETDGPNAFEPSAPAPAAVSETEVQ